LWPGFLLEIYTRLAETLIGLDGTVRAVWQACCHAARSPLVNAIRAHCAEFGLVAAQGVGRVGDLLRRAMQAGSAALPDLAKAAMALLAEQLASLEMQIQSLNRRLLAWHKQDAASQRLATIPGIGVISATALAASVADPGQFRSGREFSASLGLVPRQNSSGGKDRLGRISKMGDRYLRKLLVVGATSVVRRARSAKSNPWVGRLLERKPARRYCQSCVAGALPRC